MAALNKNTNIASYNLTSLIKRTRRTELEEIIRKEKINISLIQETRLSGKNNVKMDAKRIIRDDRGVGTAIITDNDIKTTQITDQKIVEFDFTAATININDRIIIIISLYIPCRIDLAALQDGLSKLENLISKYEGFIIGGDLNARNIIWNNTGDKITNQNGKYLQNWLNDNTHVTRLSTSDNTYRDKTKLDHFLVDEITSVRASSPRARGTSTCHSIIITTLKEIIKRETLTPVWIKDYKRANWIALRTKTKDALKPLLPSNNVLESTQEIDELITTTTEVINKAVEQSIPSVRIDSRRGVPLPQEIVNLMTKRREAWKHKRKPSNNIRFKELMTELIKELNKEIDKKLEEFENNKLVAFINRVNTEDNTFKAINQITGRKKFVDPKLVVDGREVWGSDEKVKIFRETLKETYRIEIPPNPNLGNINTDWDEIEAWEVGQEDEDYYTTNEEVKWIIKEANRKKSAGEDQLSNLIIKNLPEEFIEISRNIFNACIRHGYFPTQWKKATITPIAKKPSAKTVNDYRPIHMISNWGKILEGILLNRMKNDDGEFKGLPDRQFAYRRGHSAVNATEWLIAELTERKERGFTTGVCAMDISKAFDGVWHKGLVHKTRNILKCDTTTRMIWSFLKDRSAKVKVGTSFSEPFKQERGVPQGSKLGPILYNLYTADIKVESSEKIGHLQYADDTLIWYSGGKSEDIARGLEKEIRKISLEMEGWGIKVNKDKTTFLAIRNNKSGCKTLKQLKERGLFKKTEKQTKKQTKRQTNLQDEDEVKTADSLKYLGIKINSNLDNKAAIDHAVTKGNLARSTLNWILKRHEWDTKLKILTYKQLIRPTLTYGTEIWDEEADISKLEILERKILRVCTGISKRPDGRYERNEVLYKTANINSLRDAIDKRREKYEEKREHHTNETFKTRLNELEQKRQTRRKNEAELYEMFRESERS